MEQSVFLKINSSRRFKDEAHKFSKILSGSLKFPHQVKHLNADLYLSVKPASFSLCRSGLVLHLKMWAEALDGEVLGTLCSNMPYSNY